MNQYQTMNCIGISVKAQNRRYRCRFLAPPKSEFRQAFTKPAVTKVFSCFMLLAVAAVVCSCQPKSFDSQVRLSILQELKQRKFADNSKLTMASDLDIQNLVIVKVGFINTENGAKQIKTWDVTADISGRCDNGEIKKKTGNHFLIIEDSSNVYQVGHNLLLGNDWVIPQTCDR
jgi:hypothetical protein